ncbi:MFS transporter [Staphylococcus simiae]|uniref:Major facilitator superfamily (MFS) profile domain-containing protein n=1 Tax=Staphylococcus simiae CCM 7213 = CCUG 51256 TaxID=911238 RepID=G5JL14_9STAP|nr:MFS transporter [Staphylococcus simiae]EHJ07101.1 hypothetical protein SS7213T_10879 [Staphylococcus simiae CCM 7213 = CCUG 51256]PNZ09424.1 MFS transporter [Staphylococcus simiae]SNV60207.1 major facilitator family transporter [Staphylococcus simiae]
MKKILDRLGFDNKHNFIGFLTVITAGQLIYSSFEAFKGTFYNLLLEVLNVSNAELGTLFSLIGIAVFFYIPGGWINNRFSIKSILIFGLVVRFITMSVIIFFTPNFTVLKCIAIIWGLIDAVFWPAVLNGIIFFTHQHNRGIGFGLLESIRRTQEVLMNLLIVGVMAVISGLAVFKGGMLFYNLLIIPLIYLIIRYIPKNGIAANHKLKHRYEINRDLESEDIVRDNKSLEALKGLLHVLFTQPRIWLASIGGLAAYWSYIILIYTVPYLQSVYQLTPNQTAIFGIINTGAMGIVMGLSAGLISDYIFKSATRMMFTALTLCIISLSLVAFFKTGIILSIILLLAFSIATFLANSIILAPISEINLPEKYTGAAMSLGSFATYAPIFFVYQMNGTLLDKYHYNIELAYHLIFRIGIIVDMIGAIAILLLLFMNRHKPKNSQA